MAQGTAAMSFSSLSALSDFLKSRIQPESLSSWGVAPGTKTLHNLWIEVSTGESSIAEDAARGVLRTVNVVTLRVNNARGATLLEARQLLSDGTVRHRNRPVSEKMKAGESVEEAAHRAIAEELGPDVKARVLMDTYELRQDDSKGSGSYPGLPSRYLLHTVDAVVEEGIPDDGEFSTVEHGEEEVGDAIVVREHFWVWA